MAGTDLRDALLQSSTLTRAVLRSADLRWARMSGATLVDADLDGARFEGAILAMVNMTGAHLSDTTDFGYAFLYQARFHRTSLSRQNLVGGVGEALTDLGMARDTYESLKRYFQYAGRASDARWAHREAARMRTAAHRPDQARRYYGSGASLTSDRGRLRRVAWSGMRRAGIASRRWGDPSDSHGQRRAASRAGTIVARSGSLLLGASFQARHTAQWLLGHIVELTTCYGTSYVRLTATLMLTWLAFAAIFHAAGAIIHVDGVPVGWLDSLRYSGASLTPIDAHPLVATSNAARAMALLEGALGMILLGALGYVAASRIRQE